MSRADRHWLETVARRRHGAFIGEQTAAFYKGLLAVALVPVAAGAAMLAAGFFADLGRRWEVRGSTFLASGLATVLLGTVPGTLYWIGLELVSFLIGRPSGVVGSRRSLAAGALYTVGFGAIILAGGLGWEPSSALGMHVLGYLFLVPIGLGFCAPWLHSPLPRRG